ncbi:50S ribosomal protein L17 [Boudabousia liubingyangii]|uniref:50S ribosomal protein L17 n=1 Tax=Boudabousia liubingyangii TaxID=1921764 RepID=A0A1Q5PQJ1_9ACTO|nr:50S ribosomal protein L17 [Boudabousia liubingyangii]OKL48226.1 50S ribosomal protein L17 [Boudabousia liubingyangii]OKL49739.1 50S ribosomal protein L17 [Boudabousia liubingyangii]
MPKPAKGPRLGGSAAHERLILANLCRNVIEHRQIVTTFTRAKRVQPLLERLITKAKRGDQHARRQVIKVLGTNTSKRAGRFDYTHELFDVIVPAMDDAREGGYTRIIKLPARKGDQAPMAQLSLVMEKVEKKAAVKSAEKTAAKAAEKPAKEEKVEAKEAEKEAPEAEATEAE